MLKDMRIQSQMLGGFGAAFLGMLAVAAAGV